MCRVSRHVLVRGHVCEPVCVGLHIKQMFFNIAIALMRCSAVCLTADTIDLAEVDIDQSRLPEPNLRVRVWRRPQVSSGLPLCILLTKLTRLVFLFVITVVRVIAITRSKRLLYKAAVSICLSVCLYPPPLSTRPSDRNQIWHTYSDRYGSGYHLNKLTHPTPGVISRHM